MCERFQRHLNLNNMHKLDHLSFENCTFLELKLTPNKKCRRQTKPDISFVNAHSERDRGHDDWNLATHPFLLHFVASLKKDCDLGRTARNWSKEQDWRSEMRENIESGCEGWGTFPSPHTPGSPIFKITLFPPLSLRRTHHIFVANSTPLRHSYMFFISFFPAERSKAREIEGIRGLGTR